MIMSANSLGGESIEEGPDISSQIVLLGLLRPLPHGVIHHLMIFSENGTEM